MEISFTHPSWVCHTQLLFIFMNKPFLLWNFWAPQSYVPRCFKGCITKNARYFRNIADNEQPEVITAAMCTSTLPICNSSSYVTWSWNQVIFPNSWLVCFGSTQNSSLKLLGTLLRRLHWPESPSTCPAAKPGVCCPFRPSWLSGCRLHFQRAERFFFEKWGLISKRTCWCTVFWPCWSHYGSAGQISSKVIAWGGCAMSADINMPLTHDISDWSLFDSSVQKNTSATLPFPLSTVTAERSHGLNKRCHCTLFSYTCTRETGALLHSQKEMLQLVWWIAPAWCAENSMDDQTNMNTQIGHCSKRYVLNISEHEAL